MNLLNAWYAVELSSRLKDDTPIQVKLHGLALVLWRDSSRAVHAVVDRCPHKGASLSLGCVSDGRLRCGYHGWTFDVAGNCVEIPANKPGMAIPQRSRVARFHCREAHGFIWLWWHEDADFDPSLLPPLPPIQHVPESGDRSWRSMEGDQVWSAHWIRILEGFIDLTHVPYVHKGTFGGAAADQLYPTLEEATDDGLYALIDTPRDSNYRSEQGGNLLAQIGRAFQAKDGGDAGAPAGTQHLHLWMANFLLIRVEFKDFKIYLCLVPVPVGNGQTRLIWRHFRSFLTTPLADGSALKRVTRFLAEDRVILESMEPFEPDLDARTDLMLASDSMSLGLRKLLRAKRAANLLR